MGSTFIPSRCAVVERVGTNVLIRGNMPLLPEQDSRRGMRYAFAEIMEASGVSDLRERKLIEVPVIDNVGERLQFEPLVSAFAIDPVALPASKWPWWQHGIGGDELLGWRLMSGGVSVRGHVLWRPFEGLPEGADPKEFLGAPGWDFGGFVDRVIRLLREGDNLAVYVHCQLGADRTGAFHAGYLMRAQGLSFNDAMLQASKATSAGTPNADYYRLVRAYAATLGR